MRVEKKRVIGFLRGGVWLLTNWLFSPSVTGNKSQQLSSLSVCLSWSKNAPDSDNYHPHWYTEWKQTQHITSHNIHNKSINNFNNRSSEGYFTHGLCNMYLHYCSKVWGQEVYYYYYYWRNNLLRKCATK